MFSSGQRAGFMIGDSAGVGKGRQAAAIIMDNYARGRTKSLWVSTTGDLKLTAERDLRDIGCYVKVINGLKELDSLKASSQQTGVLFLTYATLASTARGKPRLEQVIKWLGGDRFDGPIIFDEAHKAKHFSEKGSSTKVASAVVSLQRRVPKGRVVYCSATGISEVQNVGYLDRLGLWGKGTSFEDSSDFIEHTKRKGLGFLELLSMELKAEGKYVARSLSFQSTEFREVKCVIDDGHKRHLYDQAARFWQTMRKSLNGDLERLGSEGEQINRHFWGVQQRFFKLLTLSLKVDTLIECVNSALQEGYAVVIGLQSVCHFTFSPILIFTFPTFAKNKFMSNFFFGGVQTGEAALERNDCSDFVSTIRDMLRQFITVWHFLRQQSLDFLRACLCRSGKGGSVYADHRSTGQRSKERMANWIPAGRNKTDTRLWKRKWIFWSKWSHWISPLISWTRLLTGLVAGRMWRR